MIKINIICVGKIKERYLLDAIKNCETDEVKLILNGGLSPMIIKPVKSDSFLYLVVPMRISQ